MIPMSFQEIDELISRKLHLARELLDSSEELLKTSYSTERTSYEHFLGKRAQCIEDLTQADILLKNQLNQIEPKDRPGLEERLANSDEQCRMILNRVLQIDQQNKAGLMAEMAETKQKLALLRKGQQGRNAYANFGRVNSSGAFMDSRK